AGAPGVGGGNARTPSGAQDKIMSYLPVNPVASLTGLPTCPESCDANPDIVTSVDAIRARPFMIAIETPARRIGQPSASVFSGPGESGASGLAAGGADSFSFGPFLATTRSYVAISFGSR